MSLGAKVLDKIHENWWKGKSWYLRVAHGYHHSGERVCPQIPDENFKNHLRVYEFAGQFANGRRVLDIGCGTGYGSAHLLECGASAAQGIDLAEEAIAYARRRFGKTGAQFDVMDAQRLGFSDKSFDMVFSSENLEHLPNPQACVKEVRRILTDKGIFVLGTPNCEMNVDERGLLNNPFHVKEFSFEELEAMLHPMFGTVVIFENSLESPTPWGRTMKENRRKKGLVGIIPPPSGQVNIGGLSIDCSTLNNTHSFMVVAQ